MNNKKKLHAAIPLFLVVIGMLIIHSRYQCTNDDAVLKATVLKPTVWEEFSSIAHNFTSWSSRVFVNLPIHIMLHFDYKVWMIMEIFLWGVIAWSLSYIFIDNENLRKNIILMALVLCFPMHNLVSAGWITTTMTYIWPTAACLAAMTAIRRTASDTKPIRWYHYLIYGLLIIYGANQEQMSVLMFLIFGSYTIYTIVKKEKQPLIWMQTIFATANLALHMLAPGNGVRNNASVEVYFPNYLNLSFIDKLELGFSSTLYNYVFNFDAAFFVMTLLLCILVWQKNKSFSCRMLGAAPMLMHIFFGGFCKHIVENRLHISLFSMHMTETGVITETNYYNWKHYVPIIILFAMGIFLLMAIYLAFGDNYKSIYAGAILFGGLGGRMVVAFSATVWASLYRTYTVFDIAIIMLALIFANEIELDRLKKGQYALYALVVMFAVYNVYKVYTII